MSCHGIALGEDSQVSKGFVSTFRQTSQVDHFSLIRPLSHWQGIRIQSSKRLLYSPSHHQNALGRPTQTFHHPGHVRLRLHCAAAVHPVRRRHVPPRHVRLRLCALTALRPSPRRRRHRLSPRRCPPQELRGQRQYSPRIPGGLRPLEPPCIPPLRRLNRHVPSPASHEERRQLSQHQRIQDSAQSGVCEVGSPLAVPRRTPPAHPDHPRSRSGRLPPAPPEDAPPRASLAACDSVDPSVGPPSATHPTSSLRRSRRPPPSGRSHGWPDDRLSDLVAGQASYGDPVLQIKNMPDGPGVPSAISGSADAQCGVPNEGVVGHDGAPSSDDGVPLSQEALLLSTPTKVVRIIVTLLIFVLRSFLGIYFLFTKSEFFSLLYIW